MKMTSSLDAFEKELKNKARENGTPLIGGFELTGRCNFNCRMCYVHTMDNSYALSHELSTEQWLSIMDEAYDAGMLYAILSGGECLLRPDFEEIYMHLFNKGVQVSVLTNGALIDDNHIRLFSSYRPKRLQISLYGSCDDTYESVTGIRSYEKVVNNLQKLHKANVNLHVAITANKYLLDDLENMISYLLENGIDYSVNPYLIEAREGLERDDFFSTEDEILKALRIMCVSKGKTPVPVDASCLPKAGGDCSKIINGMECNAGVYRFAISWEGYMSSCVSIPIPKVDVLKNGFLKSWEMIRQNDKKIVRAIECVDCPYKTVCVKCPVIRSKDLYCGHCNDAVCHLTMAKVQAGYAVLLNKSSKSSNAKK